MEIKKCRTKTDMTTDEWPNLPGMVSDSESDEDVTFKGISVPFKSMNDLISSDGIDSEYDEYDDDDVEGRSFGQRIRKCWDRMAICFRSNRVKSLRR